MGPATQLTFDRIPSALQPQKPPSGALCVSLLRTGNENCPPVRVDNRSTTLLSPRQLLSFHSLAWSALFPGREGSEVCSESHLSHLLTWVVPFLTLWAGFWHLSFPARFKLQTMDFLELRELAPGKRGV